MAKASNRGYTFFVWMVNTDAAEGTIEALMDQGYTVHTTG